MVKPISNEGFELIIDIYTIKLYLPIIFIVVITLLFFCICYLTYQFVVSLRRYQNLKKYQRSNPFNGLDRKIHQPKNRFTENVNPIIDNYDAKPEWGDHFKEPNLDDHLNGFSDNE